MKQKGIKAISVSCWIALAVCLIWLAIMVFRIPDEFSRLSIHAAEDLFWVRVVVYVGYEICNWLLIILGCLCVVTMLQGVRRGELFPRRNVTLLYVMAFTLFWFDFFNVNLNIAFTANVSSLPVELQSGSVVMPLIAVIFAQMYSLAHNLAEDNELTI